MELRLRRVVTGHDAQGQAIVLQDGPTEMATSRRPGQQAVVIWTTATVPADNNGDLDGAKRPVDVALVAGSAFQVIEYQPGVAGRRHRTETLDYALVISGSIDMELDDGCEVHLRAGDVVVQRGTIHNWVNRGDAPCRIAFVRVPAGPIEADGKTMQPHG